MEDPNFFLQNWLRGVPFLWVFWGIVIIWVLGRLALTLYRKKKKLH